MHMHTHKHTSTTINTQKFYGLFKEWRSKAKCNFIQDTEENEREQKPCRFLEGKHPAKKNRKCLDP